MVIFDGPMAATLGEGFFAEILMGYALKKVVKLIAANNHYAGFGRGTTNTYWKMLDLSEVTWNDKVPQTEGEAVCSNTKQTSLSDF